jgi:sulfate transport system substrate-binding protein
LGVSLLIVAVVYGRVVQSGARVPVNLVVYAFSSQEEVLTQSIFPAFEQAWEAKTGQPLLIQGVFGPSGILAGQINLGAPADVALFSNAQHVTQLKFGHRVRRETQPVTYGYSPIAIVTRRGNPASIATFADLAQPGLQLVHADPIGSGAGQWAVLAEYGSALPESSDQAADAPIRSDAAEAQLQAIWHNVRLLAPSARATMTLFELGAGDALVTYEQDALLAKERGVPLEIVIPPRTIIAQHMAVIVDDNVTPRERPVAQAFIAYLRSDAGQQAFSRYHLRPATLDRGPFPNASQSFFTAEALGGWSQAYFELIEVLWYAKIEARLDLEVAPRLLEPGQ